jgi:hypothetical protein
MKTALMDRSARSPRHRSVAVTVIALSAVLAAVALAGCGTAKHAAQSLSAGNTQAQSPGHAGKPVP